MAKSFKIDEGIKYAIESGEIPLILHPTWSTMEMTKPKEESLIEATIYSTMPGHMYTIAMRQPGTPQTLTVNSIKHGRIHAELLSMAWSRKDA